LNLEDVKRANELENNFHTQRPLVTPVPNFLFSERKPKLLPRASGCAMFSLENHNPLLLEAAQIG
jgi:hypothetical protein